MGVCRGKLYNSDTTTGREKSDSDSSRTQAAVKQVSRTQKAEQLGQGHIKLKKWVKVTESEQASQGRRMLNKQFKDTEKLNKQVKDTEKLNKQVKDTEKLKQVKDTEC